MTIGARQNGAEGASDINAVLAVSNLQAPAITSALVASQQNATAAAPGTVTIRDLSGTYELAPQENGNLLLTKAGGSSSFRFAATANGAVYGDGSTSAFIYDIREMTAFGVARFRYKPATSIARSSRIVTLVPISMSTDLYILDETDEADFDKSSSTPGVYIAVDPTGQFFVPVVCSISGETKMFLVKDSATGIATLQKPELQIVVTGGVASKCAVASLITSGQAGV